YLAPEQIRAPETVDARADIWALGVILHEAITGSVPFTADTVSGVLVAICCDKPPLVTDAPYDLARLILRCLDKDPATRPESVEELAHGLAPFAGERGARRAARVTATLTRALSRNDIEDDPEAPIELVRKRLPVR